MPLGLWDSAAVPVGWFDPLAQTVGWFAIDLITVVQAAVNVQGGMLMMGMGN